MVSIPHALCRLDKLARNRSIDGFQRILALCRDPRIPEEARWRGCVGGLLHRRTLALSSNSVLQIDQMNMNVHR
jgi:hypothetical protein